MNKYKLLIALTILGLSTLSIVYMSLIPAFIGAFIVFGLLLLSPTPPLGKRDITVIAYNIKDFYKSDKLGNIYRDTYGEYYIEVVRIADVGFTRYEVSVTDEKREEQRGFAIKIEEVLNER